MLTKEERIAVVSARLRGMTYEQTRADFARKFRKPDPTRLAIKNLVNKFQRTGSVADEECPGRTGRTTRYRAKCTGSDHSQLLCINQET